MMLSVFSDENYMRQALVEAQAAADADEVPVGAVVVVNDKIIARAHNQVELLNDGPVTIILDSAELERSRSNAK